MSNELMTAEKIAELKRLWAAATQGEWKATLPRSGRWQISNGRVQVAAVWSTTGNPGKDVAECIAAIHNAFPDLIAALEAATAERDAAKAEVARQWLTLTEIAEEVENFADCDDSEEGIANRPNLAMRVQMIADKATQCNPQAYAWLAARDARMKAEGAAEWLEQKAVEVNYLTSCDMKREAAELRRKGGA